MKAKIIATSCIALVLGLSSGVEAQLRAGSPEETAYNKITAEKNNDAKLALLLDFEKQFPTSNPKILSMIYLMAMDIYAEKDMKEKIAEYGDKAIAKDPENVSALLRVSRNYLVERTNLPKAAEHAQRARDLIVKMRAEPVPFNTNEQQWKSWLDQNETAARQYYTSAGGQ
jgi:hypothetical protein